MKKIILFSAVVAAIIFGTSCTEKYKKEIERLQAIADSLETQGVEKDTAAMSYVRAFNAIQSNLMEIKMKERMITESSEGDPETRRTKEDEINRDINAIYELLLENRKSLERLRSQLKASGQKKF